MDWRLARSERHGRLALILFEHLPGNFKNVPLAGAAGKGAHFHAGKISGNEKAGEIKISCTEKISRDD